MFGVERRPLSLLLLSHMGREAYLGLSASLFDNVFSSGETKILMMPLLVLVYQWWYTVAFF